MHGPRYQQAVRLAHQCQLGGLRLVFTNGCFAAIHAGHVAYLARAAELGDRLIVAVNSAASIRRVKGSRAVIPDNLREVLLQSLPFVDVAFIHDLDAPDELLAALRPNVLVKGGTTGEVVGRAIVEGYGGAVFRVPALPGVSTTQILASYLPGPGTIAKIRRLFSATELDL